MDEKKTPKYQRPDILAKEQGKTPSEIRKVSNTQ
jgi:hypothetical protein